MWTESKTIDCLILVPGLQEGQWSLFKRSDFVLAETIKEGIQIQLMGGNTIFSKLDINELMQTLADKDSK